MVLVDKIYELFQNAIPDYKGKICVPLSGGLDSRVLAGLIAQKRNIELSYCQYYLKPPIKEGKGLQNVRYARQIANICKVERFESICVNYVIDSDIEAIKGLELEEDLKKSRMYTGLRILNERIDLSEYTMICGHGVDSYTGIGVNPFTIFNYKDRDLRTEIKMGKYFHSIFPGTYGKFGKWDCPLWNEELIDFCLNLPFKYRFHQYLYRQMIKKYFPELAAVPREGMNVPMTIGEIRYFYERTKKWIRKKGLNEN